jgi:hypothetical protein
LRGSGWFAAVLLGLLTVTGCSDDQAPPVAESRSPDQLVAPADLAEVGQVRDLEELAGMALTLDPLPADAALIGSSYAVALHSVAVADQLDYEQLRMINLHRAFPEAEFAPLQAGPGREFLIVVLTEPESGPGDLGGDSAEVVVDGEARPLEHVPHLQEVLVVNVPTGGDAILSITEGGDTRRISLRTGGRVAGGSAADALQGGSVQLEDGVAISGVSQPGYYDGLTIQVSLQPSSQLDDQGPAGEGQMWLAVEFSVTMAGLVVERAQPQIDLAESLTIVGSDGTEIPIPAGTTVEPAPLTADGALAGADWSGAFEVPDTVRSFEVSYATHGTFTSPDGQELSFDQHATTGTGTIELTGR